MPTHKVPKRLNILVHHSLVEEPEFLKLAEQGHWITSSLQHPDGQEASLWDFDRVVGPTCWRLTKPLMKYLPTLVKSARAEKYPKKKGESDDD